MAMKQIGKLHNEMILVSLEQLVPKNHLVRKLEKKYRWDSVYTFVQHLYSTKGRPSIDPVTFFKIILLYCIEDYTDINRLFKRIQTDFAYRYFLGLSLDEHSIKPNTFLHVYEEKYMNEKVFDTVIKDMMKPFIQSSLVDVNQLRKRLRTIDKESRAYQLIKRVYKDIKA